MTRNLPSAGTAHDRPEQACGIRRRIYGRYRHPLYLERKVPVRYAWQEDAGFLQSWLHGQCNANGYWGADGIPRTAGNCPVRRWRPVHAAGGSHHDCPVQAAGEIVVYNNDCLDFIQLEMQAAGLIPWQINLNNPSFAAVADAVGIKGFYWTNPVRWTRW